MVAFASFLLEILHAVQSFSIGARMIQEVGTDISVNVAVFSSVLHTHFIQQLLSKRTEYFHTHTYLTRGKGAGFEHSLLPCKLVFCVGDTVVCRSEKSSWPLFALSCHSSKNSFTYLGAQA